MGDSSKTFDLELRTKADLTALTATQKSIVVVDQNVQQVTRSTIDWAASNARLDQAITETQARISSFFATAAARADEALEAHAAEIAAIEEVAAATEAAEQRKQDAALAAAKVRADMALEWEEGMQQAVAQQEAAQNTLSARFNTFAGNFAANLASNAVTRVQMEFEQLVRGSLALAGRLDDLSARSGQTAEALQLIGNAASQDNVQLETVAESLNNLQRSASDAAGGNTKLAKTFADLGVGQKELASLTPDELFLRLADGVKSSDDRGRALNDTLEILGRSGRSVFGTMEKGSEEIRRLSQSMGILNNATTAQLASAQESLERFKNQLITTTGGVIGTLMDFRHRFGEGLGYLTLPPVEEHLAKIDQALGNIGRKKVAPEFNTQSLTDFVEQLSKANKEAETLIERTERIASALADEEQQRIDGLVKSEMMSPEEGARRKEQASIEAERARLTRQRDAAQSALMNNAGAKARLEIDREKPGADVSLIDPQIKAIEAEQAARRAAIAEANIRLRTNRDRQGAFENANAAADQNAQAAREKENPTLYIPPAGQPRAATDAEKDAQLKAWTAAAAEQKASALAGNAIKGRTGEQGVTGQMARAIQDAQRALTNGDQGGEMENLLRLMQQFAEFAQQTKQQKAITDARVSQIEALLKNSRS